MTRKKGSGSKYGKEIKKLSDLHVKILYFLSIRKNMTKQEITKEFNIEAKREGARLIGGFSISGRLSELCGAGLIGMSKAKVEVHDPETLDIRFRKKPVWNITEKGHEQLKKPDPKLVKGFV